MINLHMISLNSGQQSRFSSMLSVVQEWMTKTSLNLTILAMEYSQIEIDQIKAIDPIRITVIEHTKLKTSPARNLLLERFYASNDKWGIVIDDDALLYDGPQHKGGYKFIDEMKLQIDRYKDICAFYPIYSRITPFKEVIGRTNQITKYDTEHIFVDCLGAKSTMTFHRNQRLYNRTEFYYDSAFGMYEDQDLYVQMKLANEQVYSTYNLILKEIDHNASFFDINNNRKQLMKEAAVQLSEKWSIVNEGKDYKKLKALKPYKGVDAILKNGQQHPSITLWNDLFDV